MSSSSNLPPVATLTIVFVTVILIAAILGFIVFYLRCRHPHQSAMFRSESLQQLNREALDPEYTLQPIQSKTETDFRTDFTGVNNLESTYSEGTESSVSKSSQVAPVQSNATAAYLNLMPSIQQQQQQSSISHVSSTNISPGDKSHVELEASDMLADLVPFEFPRRKSQPAILTSSGEGGTQTSHTTVTLVTNGKTLSLPGFLMLMLDVDFRIESGLAEGGSGMVYRGDLINATAISRNSGLKSCVVKDVKENKDAVEETSNGFLQEVAVMWLFSSSKYFVKLLGYSPEPQMMIMKFYHLGSLKDILYTEGMFSKANGGRPWTPRVSVSFAYDVANALAEMHHTGVVHSDVKAANILVDNDEIGELFLCMSDFGVSAVVDESLLRVKAMPRSVINGASIAYAAPEVFDKLRECIVEDTSRSKHVLISKASDTYAYGVLLYELIGRKRPWGMMTFEEIEAMVGSGGRPRFPDDMQEIVENEPRLHQLAMIMNRCWAQDAQLRPTMKHLLPDLYKMYNVRDFE